MGSTSLLRNSSGGKSSASSLRFRPHKPCFCEGTLTILRGAGRALQLPDTREFFGRVGYEVTGTTPEEMAAVIRTETAQWAKVIKAANIRAE